MEISIQFIGAAETVTGSCFLVTAGDTKFIVDCGMYQGPEVEIRNLEDFPFNASEIDFVLLTHTHIDHSGMLPKLTKHGFRGPIFATFHTVQLATILLLDSAKIQENNYKNGIPWKHAGKVQLVFGTRDAEDAITMMEVVEFNETFEPAAGKDIKVTYVRAGHVLGAASLEVEVGGKVIVFSGDIGRVNQDLIPAFNLDYKREVDYVLMESLYGGQEHPQRSESVGELMRIIRETIEKGGSVYIPCFAVQRTQEILNDIKLAKSAGALPADMPVYLDSPMGQRVTHIYADALDHGSDSAFNFPNLNYVRNFRRSQKMSRKKGQVVIAGSGMAEGGRILSHIAANIGDPKNAFVFVGFQAESTLGRDIVSGMKDIIIDKTNLQVKAQIYHLQGFSAHGATPDYIAWLNRYISPRLKQTFLIHAEPTRAQAMQQVMLDKGLDHPYIPKRNEKVVLK